MNWAGSNVGWSDVIDIGKRREKRVVHLTSVHPASDPRIYSKECASLANAGYRVTLVATGQVAEDPADGVTVRTFPKPPSRIRRMAWGSLRGVVHAARLRPAVVHLHDPELIPWGLVFKFLGARVIYDAHEDLSAQIMSKSYLPSITRPVVALAASLLIRMADRAFDAIVVATPAIASRYTSEKTVLVQNFPLVEEWGLSRAEKRELVAYVGAVTEIRGIWQMLEAFRELGRDGLRLTIAGPIQPPSLLSALEAHPCWSYVDYRPWLSRREVAEVLNRAFVGLVLLQPEPNYIASQPTKLFEYMAAGAPVVASDFPLCREILATVGCGVTVDPTDPRAIAEAIRSLSDRPNQCASMGEAGRDAIARTFNWQAEASRLIDLYDTLMS